MAVYSHTNEMPEADVSGVEVNVVLPTGTVKERCHLNVEGCLVREEKERILREEQIPYPSLYVMVILGDQGSSKLMEDSRMVEDYVSRIAKGTEITIEIKKKSSQIERPARPIKPELFNVQMKN